MTTPTLFVDCALAPGARIRLSGPERHYLVRVLRLRPGDAVRLSDRGSVTADAELEEAGADSACLLVRSVRQAPPARFRLTLVTSPLKRKGTELVAARAAELGLDRLVLAGMRRSVVRLGPDRLERIRRVAAEAARQVGQPQVTQVELSRGLEQALAAVPAGPVFFLWERGGISPRSMSLDDADSATCIVGPEGGFAAEEVDLMCAAGASPVMLSGPAYTAATAAVAAAVLFQFLGGRL